MRATQTWKNVFVPDPFNVTVGLILIVLVLHHITALSLFKVWTSPNNPTYSHGPLLLIVCAFLFFKKLMTNAHALQMRTSVFGILLLLAISLVELLADLGNVQVIQYLALIGIIATLLWSLFGFSKALPLVPPLAFMLFAVPVWDFLTSYLQIMTVPVVNHLVRMAGITSVINGFAITIPEGAFEVNEGCSGLNQLVVALTIAALYAYLRRTGIALGLLWIVLAALLAFSANVVRIFLIIVAGHLTNMQHYLVTVEHVSLGWMLFAVAMALFVSIVTRYSRPAAIERNVPGRLDEPFLDQSKSLLHPFKHMRGPMLALSAIAVGPMLSLVYEMNVNQANVAALLLPERNSGWDKNEAWRNDWRPRIAAGDAIVHGSYRHAENGVVHVYISYFHKQEQGREAVNDNNAVYDNAIWKRYGHGKRQITVVPEQVLQVEETKIHTRDGRETLVWRWYYVGGRRTSSDSEAKALNVLGMLRGDPGISVFVLATDAREGVDDASERLRRFVADNMELLEEAIRRI